MLPAIVIVALPPNTPPTEAQALLAACDKAYQAGDCREPSDEPPALYVMAEVTWVSDTHAEVSVRYETTSTERSATRSMEFREQDNPTDRFTSLGFAIGSLAGQVGQSASDAEARSGADPATPLESSNPPPAVESSDPTEVPSVTVESESAPIEFDVPSSPIASTPLESRDEVRFGLSAGTGLDGTRWGLGLGARRTWNKIWLLDLSAGFATQNANDDDIEGTFISVSLTSGVEVNAAPLRLSFGVGPAVQWLRFVRSPFDRSATVERLGVDVALAAQYGESMIAPYLELRGGSWFDPVDIQTSDDQLRELGPVQGQVSVGIVLALEETK